MIAALPWYDLPEVAGALDAFWSRWAGAIGVSVGLTRARGCYEIAAAPDLLVTQVCGVAIGGLEVVGTPVFEVPGCRGPLYSSHVVVRSGERLRDGLRAAANDPRSWSGYHVLRTLGLRFRSVDVTGAHTASVDAVRSGRADVAAIDAVTWALLERWRPGALRGLSIVGCTELAPAPPWVSRGRAVRLRAGLGTAISGARPEEREGTRLVGWELLGPGAYGELVARAAGLPPLWAAEPVRRLSPG